MKKKKRRSISLSARAPVIGVPGPGSARFLSPALPLCVGFLRNLVWFFWRDLDLSCNISHIIALFFHRTDELRQHTPYRMLYVLTLQDGTKVAVSSDEAKSPFSSLEDSRQHFVIGKPITCTYVRRPAFSNGEFALLSVTCGEEELYPESAGIAPFKDRTGICLMFDFILWGAALPLLIVPPLRAAIRKRKSRLKKEQRKQARREKLRSGNGQ